MVYCCQSAACIIQLVLLTFSRFLDLRWGLLTLLLPVGLWKGSHQFPGTTVIWRGVCFRCLSMICSVQCGKNSLLPWQPHDFCQPLRAAWSPRCTRARGDERLSLYSRRDAAEHWYCRCLFYVKLHGRAGGKDTMCRPVWWEVGLAGEGLAWLVETGGRLPAMEWRAGVCPPFLQCWAHVAVTALVGL